MKSENTFFFQNSRFCKFAISHVTSLSTVKRWVIVTHCCVLFSLLSHLQLNFFEYIYAHLFAGRCYVPNNYFEKDELKYLVTERNPHQIPNAQLKKFAERMLDIADRLADESSHAINLLPQECQRAVLSALEIYQGIGKLIRNNQHYERRTFLSKGAKIRIVLKCMYTTSMASLNERCTKKKN